MKTKVLIIGGGIAGLSLSCLLARHKIPNIVVETRNLTKPQNIPQNARTAALMGSSVDILKKLEIWEELEAQTAPLETMRIIDDSDPNREPVQVDFHAHEIGKSSFGHNIPNYLLQKTLIQKASSSPHIALLSPARLTKLKTKTTYIEATLDNDKTITADICIGADGRNSQTRTLSGIEVNETDYDQSAITCLIQHSKPHHNISTEHHRPGGPFTIVPMPDNDGTHCSSIVWIEKTNDANQFLTLNKKDFEQALQDRTRNVLGKVILTSPPESWPLKALIAKEIISPRIALIAEAAHVMSPIGAQGLNLSLRDVSSLTDILVKSLCLGEDIGSLPVLERYAQQRRSDMMTRFHGVDRYNKIVSNNIGFLRDIRRAGLTSLRSISALKHVAMKEGLSPSLPEERLA